MAEKDIGNAGGHRLRWGSGGAGRLEQEFWLEKAQQAWDRRRDDGKRTQFPRRHHRRPVPEALLEKNVAPWVGRGCPLSPVPLYYLHTTDPLDERNSSVSIKQL